jgi:hypothetical protein
MLDFGWRSGQRVPLEAIALGLHRPLYIPCRALEGERPALPKSGV